MQVQTGLEDSEVPPHIGRLSGLAEKGPGMIRQVVTRAIRPMSRIGSTEVYLDHQTKSNYLGFGRQIIPNTGIVRSNCADPARDCGDGFGGACCRERKGQATGCGAEPAERRCDWFLAKRRVSILICSMAASSVGGAGGRRPTDR